MARCGTTTPHRGCWHRHRRVALASRMSPPRWPELTLDRLPSRSCGRSFPSGHPALCASQMQLQLLPPGREASTSLIQNPHVPSWLLTDPPWGAFLKLSFRNRTQPHGALQARSEVTLSPCYWQASTGKAAQRSCKDLGSTKRAALTPHLVLVLFPNCYNPCSHRNSWKPQHFQA